MCLRLIFSFQEFQLLPKLARAQPLVDKAKLQSASSVEEALEIAHKSLQAEATVYAFGKLSLIYHRSIDHLVTEIDINVT